MGCSNISRCDNYNLIKFDNYHVIQFLKKIKNFNQML